MAPIKIQQIDLIDGIISIIYNGNWFQEDINELSRQLFNKIDDHIIKEVILGADRESRRFLWLNTQFTLHFDYYSQSCWFSPLDEMSVKKMKALHHLLTENQNENI